MMPRDKLKTTMAMVTKLVRWQNTMRTYHSLVMWSCEATWQI